MPMKTVDDVLSELRTRGKPSTAKTYARHGVRETTVGLPYSELGKLVKKLGTDHQLAQALWASGVHDARVLATRVADAATMTAKELDGWLGEASNYVIAGAISELAARTPRAQKHAARWLKSKGEWRSATGWNVMARLAVDGLLDDETAGALLDRVGKDIHGARNRTRHSMNGALIAIGGSLPQLRARAVEVAKAIGKVEVDHGATGCKTPDAVAYIERMVARARSKGQHKRARC